MTTTLPASGAPASAAVPATGGAAPAPTGAPGQAAGAGAGPGPAGGPAQQPFASASLYCGDLDPAVTEALLFDVFNAVGPVASVRVCRDAATRRSLGYAYVNYHRAEDAERALDTLNFKNIRNRPCRIMWSHRDPSLRKSGVGNIFVKNLAKGIDNKTLYDTFSIFGNILSCKVATNSKGESLGYGFVHFENDEAAALAISRVDGKLIGDEKVSVAAFKSKKERGAGNKSRFTNLYVKNLPLDWNKEKLDELFAKHGTVTSSVIAMDKEGKSRGFGFVNLAAPEEATAAIQALHEQEIEKGSGKKLFVSRALKHEEREKEKEAMKLERARKLAGVNLYVKNLSDDWDDERLRAEFGKFGAIQSARIARDSTTKRPRGFGFVCFTQQDEATKAVTEMNGKLIDGKPLYVALHQRKEVRRAQQEARQAQAMRTGGFGRGVGGVGVGGPMGMGFPAQPMFYPGGPAGVGVGGVPGVGVGGLGMRPMIPYQQSMRWAPNMQNMQPNTHMMQPHMGEQGMMMRGQPPMGLVAGAGRAGPDGHGPRRGGGQGGRGQRRPGGPGVGVGGPGVGASMGGPGAPPGGHRVQLEAGVRNPRAPAPQEVPGGRAEPSPALPTPGVTTTLTIEALAAAPEEQQKQMIGEHLFPRIKLREPVLAGKITGMLLEMDNGELIHLLEHPDALNEKIVEAKEVLEQHQQAAGQE